MAGLGKALDGAVKRYNDAVGGLETRVLPQARRFRELGAAPEGNVIEPLSAVDAAARRLSAPELSGDAAGAETLGAGHVQPPEAGGGRAP
jgi:DNA recombination protein RmuC